MLSYFVNYKGGRWTTNEWRAALDAARKRQADANPDERDMFDEPISQADYEKMDSARKRQMYHGSQGCLRSDSPHPL